MKNKQTSWRVSLVESTNSPIGQGQDDESGLSLTLPSELQMEDENERELTAPEMSPIFDHSTTSRPNRDAATLLLNVASQIAIIDQVAKSLAIRLGADILMFSQLPVIMASIRLRMPIVDLKVNMSKSIAVRLANSSLGNFQRYQLILADFANKKKLCLQEEKAKASSLLDEFTSLPDQISWIDFMEKCVRQFILEVCQDEEMNIWYDHKVVTKIIEERVCQQYGLPFKDIVILAPLSYKPLGPKHRYVMNASCNAFDILSLIDNPGVCRIVPIIGSYVPQASKDLILPYLG
ncbi:hypothetical protein EON65_13815 [archaeon]|nr:MAG: hypothetical protein EON65_13815 [archaeon]